ncbi:MAG: HIT domain-containing protein [bacterium]
MVNTKISLRLKVALIGCFLLVVLLTFWLGLYIGMKTQPRSLISLNKCQKNCLNIEEAAGLVGSVGISLNGQKPFVLKENDSCFSIKMPFSKAKYHYVIIPKKDIKDLGDLAKEDSNIIQGCVDIAIEHIQQEKLENYYFKTNGPQLQDVRYLHFHLTTID